MIVKWTCVRGIWIHWPPLKSVYVLISCLSSNVPFSSWHILPSILATDNTASCSPQLRAHSQNFITMATTFSIRVLLFRKEAISTRASMAAERTQGSSSLVSSISWGNTVLLAMSSLWGRRTHAQVHVHTINRHLHCTLYNTFHGPQSWCTYPSTLIRWFSCWHIAVLTPELTSRHRDLASGHSSFFTLQRKYMNMYYNYVNMNIEAAPE